MVRLEKAIYEQILNSKALKRSRIIAAPSKWYTENRNDAYKVASHKIFNQGLTAIVFKFFEPILAKFTWRWMRDIALQRGLAMEDFLLFQDRQLRRCYFFETVARQSLHPYTWIFFKRRRARFYKVERGVRGVYAPDWCRQEASNRTLADTLQNKEIWENFIYKEYMSEQTPTSRWSVLSKWNPLEMFLLYGLWRPEAWDRYFYNEVFYEGYTQEEIKEAVWNPFPGINLNTEDGRLKFEEEVRRFQKLYPGTITRDGEEFNFKRFYAEHSLAQGKDIGGFDKTLIENLKKELSEITAVKKDTAGNNLGKKLGKILPDFLRQKPGKAYF